MATIKKFALIPSLTPSLDVGPYWVKRTIDVNSGDAASGDLVELLTFQRDGTAHLSQLHVSASLGAATTVKLAVGDGTSNKDLTAASAAGNVANVFGSSMVPIKAGDKLYAVVAGGGIGSAAQIVASIQVQH
jgi:hypothetical protein